MSRNAVTSLLGAAILIAATSGSAMANIGNYDPSEAFIAQLSTTHRSVLHETGASSGEPQSKSETYDAQQNFFAGLTTGGVIQHDRVQASGNAVVARSGDFSKDFIAGLSTAP